MKISDLFDKVKKDKTNNVKEENDKILIELKNPIKINGKNIISMLKNKDKIELNYVEKEEIKHEGENIDYSVYGTPKLLWVA